MRNIRLAGSTKPLEGRVEVYRQGEWGRVCMLRKYGPTFTNDNLNVVCRELGFFKGVSVTNNYPGTGRIWLENVRCNGGEKAITSCFHDVKSSGNPYCIDNKDVSVECKLNSLLNWTNPGAQFLPSKRQSLTYLVYYH